LLLLTANMEKILVIEDDTQVRDSVSLSLEAAGYEVIEAATCEEGFQNQKQFFPSVIISDIVSLEHEGGELLRRICQQSAGIPLITLMGTLSDSQARLSRGNTFMPDSRHTLQKPFTLDELLATVQTALIR